MDRYEVPMESWLEPLVEAAERGDDVVIMREGEEVARIYPFPEARSRSTSFDVAALEKLRAKTVIPGFDAIAAVRAIRDEDSD